VGCGNGFLTDILRARAKHVDAFDYAENMVSEARRLYGETNNRFFHDNVLAPRNLAGPYDAIVCVRVLINLRDLGEQATAVRNLAAQLRRGGTLILIEGYSDGFAALNELRRKCGIDPLRPAAINFYASVAELMPVLQESFEIKGEFHSGAFDYLTRVVYPLLVGADKATGHADFHRRILPAAKAFNPAAFEPLARLRGFSLARR